MKTQKKAIKVKAIPFIQNSKVAYITVIPSHMLNFFHFDIHNPDTGKGYNRDDKLNKRSEDFKNFLSISGMTCPTAIVVNDRNNSIKVRKNNDSPMVDLTFDENSKATIAEGQGRAEGYKKAHKDGNEMEIPVIITKTPKSEEIFNTRTINSKMKKMATNITYSLSLASVKDYTRKGKSLQQIWSENKELLLQAISYKVVWHLNKKNPMFRGRFMLPNQKKLSKPERLRRRKNFNERTINIGTHAHGNNLKGIVHDYLEKNLHKYKSFERVCLSIYNIINDFWMAFYSVNSKIFDRTITEYEP